MGLMRAIFLLSVALLLGALAIIAMMIGQDAAQAPVPRHTDAEVIAASQGIKGQTEPRGDYRRLLEEAAAAGNALAQNNLAVLHLRSRAPGSRDEAIRLLDSAVAQGLIAARYNRALLMPSGHDLPVEQIRQQIDLLQANVDEGDVHSMVLLARRLYFVNRDRVQRDRAGYKLALLSVAAQSDDPEYVYLYGREIWDIYRSSKPIDPAQGVDALLWAYELGEPRAADLIAEMIQSRDAQPILDHLETLGEPTSALTWSERAAEGGLWRGSCSYVQAIDRSIIGSEPERVTETDMTNWVNGWLQDMTPETQERWLYHLDICRQTELRTVSPNLPFGDDALYWRKTRGGWPSYELGWPGNSETTLAYLYRFGPNRDIDKARYHLERAQDTYEKTFEPAVLELFQSPSNP